MSDPYRDSSHRDPTDAPRDGGIVGDVIAQFADPHAFYRELVQNAIDAGSPEVGITLSYDTSEQKMRVAVRDRGGGMTRDVIENQLLVLFRSTKEKDKSKIGKFGVGFASVLSPNPEVVIVNSSRDGKRLTLHLFRDLTYELFDGGRATQAGTTVELVLPLAREQVTEFEQASERALRRWCRHASVPIELELGRGEARRALRIDMPLAIDGALVHVTRTFDDGALTVVAGLTPAAYLGFFNHGLMLHETAESVLAHCSVKVQDSRLGHTISRDDVRRDDHYKRALDAAEDVLRNDLATMAATRLHELADAGGGGDYCELVDAIVASRLELKTWWFPLVDPVADKRVVTGEQLPRIALVSGTSTPLTRALAKTGVHVVKATRRTAIDAGLDFIGRVVTDAHRDRTAVYALEPTAHDVAIIAMLREIFDAVLRAPAGIELVELAGAREDLLAIALPKSGAHVLDGDAAVKNPFSVFGRRTLGLSVSHPHVKAARSGDDPMLAASHLARAILLQYGQLDADRSARLVGLVLERIGVGT